MSDIYKMMCVVDENRNENKIDTINGDCDIEEISEVVIPIGLYF